jgi:hypothetical protein
MVPRRPAETETTPCPWPGCTLPAELYDANYVDIGVGVQRFEEQWKCPSHGVFGHDSQHEVVWRDGEASAIEGYTKKQIDLINSGEMSAGGKCMSGHPTPTGGWCFCDQPYGHPGKHGNFAVGLQGIEWTGGSLADALVDLRENIEALDELLAP